MCMFLVTRWHFFILIALGTSTFYFTKKEKDYVDQNCLLQNLERKKKNQKALLFLIDFMLCIFILVKSIQEP